MTKGKESLKAGTVWETMDLVCASHHLEMK